jgi:ribonuclease III
MKTDQEYTELASVLKLEFNNIDHFKQSLVHRSYLNEHRDFPLDHNERLEFLGDAVLELVVTEYLYLNYPNPEGELTNWRAALVNSKMLAELSTEAGIEEYLFLSKGESKDTGKARQYILANAFEAIIGSIYIDQGWDASKKFITERLLKKLDHILEHKLYLDPKSKFQEMAQERLGITPSYQVVGETGPDHEKEFEVVALLKDAVVAKGTGTSKQEAQVSAAAAALAAKGWD